MSDFRRSRLWIKCCTWYTGNESDCEQEYNTVAVREDDCSIPEDQCAYILEKLQVKRVYKSQLEPLDSQPCQSVECPNPYCAPPEQTQTCKECFSQYGPQYASKTTQVPSITKAPRTNSITSRRWHSIKILKDRSTSSYELNTQHTKTVHTSTENCCIGGRIRAVNKPTETTKPNPCPRYCNIQKIAFTSDHNNKTGWKNISFQKSKQNQDQIVNEDDARARYDRRTRRLLTKCRRNLQQDSEVKTVPPFFVKEDQGLQCVSENTNAQNITFKNAKNNFNWGNEANTNCKSANFDCNFGKGSIIPGPGPEIVRMTSIHWRFRKKNIGPNSNRDIFKEVISKKEKMSNDNVSRTTVTNLAVKNNKEEKKSVLNMSKDTFRNPAPRFGNIITSSRSADFAYKMKSSFSEICNFGSLNKEVVTNNIRFVTENSKIQSRKNIEQISEIELLNIRSLAEEILEHEKNETEKVAAVNLYENLKFADSPRPSIKEFADISETEPPSGNLKSAVDHIDLFQTTGNQSQTKTQQSRLKMDKSDLFKFRKKSSKEKVDFDNISMRVRSGIGDSNVSLCNDNANQTKEIFSIIEAFKKSFNILKRSNKETSTSMSDVRPSVEVGAESTCDKSDEICCTTYDDNMVSNEKIPKNYVPDFKYPVYKKSQRKTKMYIDCSVGSNTSLPVTDDEGFISVRRSNFSRSVEKSCDYIPKMNVDTAAGTDDAIEINKDVQIIPAKLSNRQQNSVMTQYSARQLDSQTNYSSNEDIHEENLSKEIQVEIHNSDQFDKPYKMDSIIGSCSYRQLDIVSRDSETINKIYDAPNCRNEKPKMSLRSKSSVITNLDSNPNLNRRIFEKQIFLPNKPGSSVNYSPGNDRKKFFINAESSFQSRSSDLEKHKVLTIERAAGTGTCAGDSKLKSSFNMEFTKGNTSSQYMPRIDTSEATSFSDIVRTPGDRSSPSSNVASPIISPRFSNQFIRNPEVTNPFRNCIEATSSGRNQRNLLFAGRSAADGEFSNLAPKLNIVADKTPQVDSGNRHKKNQDVNPNSEAGSSLKWVIMIKHPENKTAKTIETHDINDEEPCRLGKDDDIKNKIKDK